MGIDFKAFFNFILFIAAVLAIIMFLVGKYSCNKSIKSNKPINPKIELVVKNNKVDTIYVYSLD